MNEAKKIVLALRDIGIKQGAIAERLGISQPSVNGWVNRGSEPTSGNMDKLRALARENGIECGPRELRRVSVEDEAREDYERWAETESGMASGIPYRPKLEGGIPEVDVSAGAGQGAVGEVIALQVGETGISAHKVTAEWVVPVPYLATELGLSRAHTVVIPIHGDSMEPTYRAGDRVLVDLTCHEITTDGVVYLISDSGDEPQIKRLQKVPGSDPKRVKIISDNPILERFEVPLDTIAIIGRVAGKVTKQ